MRTLARPLPRRWSAVVLVATLLVLSMPGDALAAPAVTTTGPASYTEQDVPTLIGTGLDITGGSAYDGNYIEFDVDGGVAGEHLSLATVDTPSTADGVVSVVDSAVYVGDGTDALPIGTVDPVRDGRDGHPLRVDLSNHFGNPGFETGDITSWTALSQRIDLGVTPIAGFTAQDTSTYPTTGSPSYYPWVAPDEDNHAPVSASYNVGVTTSGSPTEGTYALRLDSNMTTAGGCDVVHGPAVHSGTFEAAAGDRIYFDWRAFAGNDAYHVFGYVLDEHGVQTEVLDAYTHDTNGSTSWATKETVIPSNGTYRFVFVAGTFDATCGQAAGAQLLIDNVRVFGNKVTDAVVTSLGHLLQYENTSDDPPTSRTVSVTAPSQSNGTATGAITVDITPVDDPPTLDDPGTVTFTNTEDDDVFDDVFGTLTAWDPDSDVLTYDAVGATGSDWRVVDGTYATLRVHTSGAYTVVPDDAALEAALTPETETFIVIVAADGARDDRTLTVQVAIAASPPGAPTITSVAGGDRQADLAWSPGTWIGGSPTTDYVVEVTTDEGATWSTVDDGVSATTDATASGLEPGIAHRFRVAATNASGTGDWSTTSDPVTPKAQQVPLDVDATDITYGDTATLDILGGSGTGEVTYSVVTGPCTVEGDALATTDVGACTLRADKAGDTTYYAAEEEVTIQVTPRPLTVTGATVVGRPYDGTNTAQIMGAGLHGLVHGDDVDVVGATTGTFAQTGVGTAIPVTTSMTLSGDHAHRYALAQPVLSGTIQRRVLTVQNTTVATRVYDGTTDAVLAGATLTGVVAGEDVTLVHHTAGTFARADVGRVIPVATTMSLSGADIGNYMLRQPEVFGRIAVRALQVTDALVAPRAYDGTATATLRGARLVGVLAGDDVVLVDEDRGTYASEAPDEDIRVTTAMSLAGDDGHNYAVVQPDLTGTITRRTVRVVGATVATKVADGERTAVVEGARLDGVVDGDDVRLADADAGTFATSDVDLDVAVRTRMSLAGRDAASYALTQPTLVGEIVPAVTVQTGEGADTATGPSSPGDRSTASVRAGEAVTTQLCNLEPGSTVTAVLDATGEAIGEARVDEDGCALVTAVLPHHVSAGVQDIRFEGRDLAGGPMTASRRVTVEATPPPAAPTGDLAATGAPLASLVVLAMASIAFGLPLVRRRTT